MALPVARSHPPAGGDQRRGNDQHRGRDLPSRVQGANRQPLTDEHPKFDLEITTFFTPSAYLQEKIRVEREQKLKDAKEEKEREYKEKLFKAVEERVKLASEIVPRKFEDLREEERIVVYRKLIAQLLPTPVSRKARSMKGMRGCATCSRS